MTCVAMKCTRLISEGKVASQIWGFAEHWRKEELFKRRDPLRWSHVSRVPSGPRSGSGSKRLCYVISRDLANALFAVPPPSLLRG